MRTPMFSILVVSLNPGGKLVETIRSVTEQTYKDYEVVVKDGGSRDGSLDMLKEFLRAESAGERVRILEQADSGIYDGMNQATRAAKGEYLYFLNCGDLFASEDALAQAAGEIEDVLRRGDTPGIFYGDILDALRGQVVASNPVSYTHLRAHET